MTESYSVEAVLSARDKGFAAGMRAAMGQTESLGSKLKSGIGFGAFMAIGSKAVSAVGNGLRGLLSEMSESSAAWKTFTGNMKMNGYTNKQIAATRSELSKFAVQTIYSASDMASTYSQLAAVGTKNTTKLVKGFGGLAAASENPKQAMKTLSQQATQMAAKPTVQWQDFKLMLEQTPAGIAAVAKQMGKTTGQLVKDVQDGKIKTEDFFDAVQKVGTNKSFTKLATQYKTVDQAMDGLKETIGTQLQPAFDTLSGVAIKAISGIVDAFGKIDGNKIAASLQSFFAKAGKYAAAMQQAFKGVGKAWGEAFGKIGGELGKLNGAFGSTRSVKSFKGVMTVAANAIRTLGEFASKHAKGIAKIIRLLPKLAIGFVLLKVATGIGSKIKVVANGVSKLAGALKARLGSKMAETAAGEAMMGKSSAASAKEIMAAAVAIAAVGASVLMASAGFLLLAKGAVLLAESGPASVVIMLGMVAAMAALAYGASLIGTALTGAAPGLIAFGAAVLMVGAGFALVALGANLFVNAAINLANAGAPAVLCMAAMAVVVAGLAIVFAALGPALTAGAVGMLAFGIAVALVGAGALMASIGIKMVAQSLPQLAAYGSAGAVAILQLGAALMVFAVGALLAGAGGLVLGAGLLVAGAGALVAGMGMLVLAGAVKLVQSGVKGIAASAKSAVGSLRSMQGSVSITKAGLGALGSAASGAMGRLRSAFSGALAPARSAGTQIGNGFKSGMQPGLNAAVSAARSGKSRALSALNGGYSSAYSAGHNIGSGFANGMRSMLGTIRAAAAQMAAAADKAVRAKAKIKSPARTTIKDGRYWGEGLAIGITDKIHRVRKAAAALIEIPKRETLSYDSGPSTMLSDSCHYGPKVYVTAEVTSNLDGRKVGYGTAAYVQEKNDYDNKRRSRIRGELSYV